MKFAVFKKQAELLETRLAKIYKRLQDISTPANELTPTQINRIKLLTTEAKKKQNSFTSYLNQVLNEDEEEEEATGGKTYLNEIAKKQETIEDLLIEIFTLSENLLPKEEQPQSPAPHTGKSQSNVKLPELKLFHFSGKETEWVNFYDFFENTIHKN